MSLNAFIEAVEDLRIARGVSKDAHLHELLQGLREEFQPPDYDTKLFEEVKRRAQGVGESIGMYLSVMSGLFSRFNVKISEDTQLKILLKNILPFYQTQLSLTEVSSVAQLL